MEEGEAAMFWIEAPAWAGDLVEERALVAAMRPSRVATRVPLLPASAYDRAAKGEVVTGVAPGAGGSLGTGWALAIVDRRVEDLWVALNTEEAHVGRFDLVVSEVIAGDPHATGRRVWQVVDLPAWFADRWLCVDEAFGAAVYTKSEGRMWEIAWTDATRVENLGGRVPPGGAVPVAATSGGWLLVPLADGRTLVEVHGSTDPGGNIPASATTGFAATALAGAIRDLGALARELVPRSRRGYRRPDGSSL